MFSALNPSNAGCNSKILSKWQHYIHSLVQNFTGGKPSSSTTLKGHGWAEPIYSSVEKMIIYLVTCECLPAIFHCDGFSNLFMELVC